jgi:hypothetical protein
LIYKTIGIENEIGAGVPYLNYQNYSTGNPFGIRFEIPIKYKVELENNTMASTSSLAQQGQSPFGGYATIADNHIESCIWRSGDDAANISSTDNSFDYLPGQNVGQNCPQPPECTIQLKDQMNVVLPKTNIDTDHSPDGYSYISAGSPINIAVSPGSLGSQTNAFIIQPNPNHGNPLTYNSSANNDFFNDREIIGPATGTQIKANYSYDVARPGLYGIDALAVAATNSTNPLWQEYNSSTWQHIPLIVKPSYDESHLIFNIKDSYYEEYTANGSQPYPETHVLKTAELNGHRIWQEDIAEGGDGWERIDIPMNSINPDWIVPASDENKNLLTFSINFDSPTISISSVQGVSVWVDDIYINRYSSAKGTNLIADGDVENEGCGKLTTYAALGANPTCSWFKLGNTSPNYPIVCVTTSFAANNSGNDEVLYNDGNPISITQAGPWICDSYLSGKERKSGQTSLVLDLPRIDGGGCPYYIVPPLSQVPTTVPIDPLDIYQFYPGVISVYTLFEYPRCGAFADDLEDQFSDLNAASAPPINNSNFNLNHNLRLAAGTTLELNNCVIAIGPEVSITVPATSTLKVNNSTLSACGEDMWKGIILEPGATLKTNTSTFADAEQAIYLHTAGSGLQNIIDAQIENCTFNSNYIGIDMEPTPSQTFNNIKLIVMQSTFNSPYPLKSSKNFTVCAQTYAGINLNDWTGIIGKYASSPNIFENVSFGIRSIRCALTVWSSKFIGIREDHLFVTPNSGTGIYAEGNSPGYILKQYGFGQAFDPSFSECDLGILSNGVACSIVGNNMISMNRGILLSNLAASSTSNVTANTIHCNFEGIISQFPNNIKQLTINADSVFVNNDTGINNYGIGIGSFDASGTAANVSILGNYVKMENATMGIHTNGTVGNIVANNKINMTDNSVEEAISISAYSGGSNVISCNSAFGNTNTQWANQRGYNFSITTENEISCNNASDIYYGFEFDDDCHMMGKFIGNSMHNHFVGLNFNQDGVIAEQRHCGNSWTGTYSSGNEAVDPNSSASLFFVNLSNDPIYNPSNPNPSFGWFNSDNTGSAFNCSAPKKVCGTKENGGGGNSALEKAIADGSYNPTDFPEESFWMAQLFLFQKLMKDPGAISDPTLLAFYNSNINSNLDEINKIRKETASLPTTSFSDSTILANNDSLLRQNITMLENVTKSLYDGRITEAQYNATSDQLKQVIENLSEISRQIEDNIRNQRNQQAETIRTLNSLITTTKHYEENEKFVSDLYLKTVGKRITEVSTNDQSQLLSIAHECPFIGGQAVYKARALYRLINPLEEYDDYPLCHSLGLLKKRPSENSPLLESVVFPNPCSTSATLAYSILEDTKTILEIFDFSLKLIATEILNNDERQKQLDFSQYKQGLYIYNIIQNNHVISSGKFSIVR